MRSSHTVVKNSVVLFSAEVVGSTVHFVVLILIARHLGIASFGRYSFVMAFVTLFQLIADMGVSNILIREVATKKDELGKWLGAAKSLMWGLSFVAFALMVISINLSSSEQEIRYSGYIMGIAVLATFHAVLYSAVFRAFEEMEYMALGYTLHKILLLVLISLAIVLGYQLIGIFVAYLVANLSLWGFYYRIVVRRYIRPRLLFDTHIWRTLLIESIPLGLGALLRKAGWQVDILILTRISTIPAVGFFSAAYKIVQSVNLLPVVFAMPLFPVFSKLAVGAPDKFERLYQQSFKLLFLIGVPIALTLSILSEWIVRLAYGAQFLPAAQGLQLLAPTMLFLFVTSTFPYLFIALGRQGLYTFSTGFCLVVNILLDVILIPSYGFLGACIGTLVAEMSLFAMGTVFLARLGYRLHFVSAIWKPLVSGSILGLILYGVSGASALWIIVGSASGCLLYVALLVVMKIFSVDEMAPFIEILQSRRIPFLSKRLSPKRVRPASE